MRMKFTLKLFKFRQRIFLYIKMNRFILNVNNNSNQNSNKNQNGIRTAIIIHTHTHPYIHIAFVDRFSQIIIIVLCTHLDPMKSIRNSTKQITIKYLNVFPTKIERKQQQPPPKYNIYSRTYLCMKYVATICEICIWKIVFFCSLLLVGFLFESQNTCDTFRYTVRAIPKIIICIVI